LSSGNAGGGEGGGEEEGGAGRGAGGVPSAGGRDSRMTWGGFKLTKGPVIVCVVMQQRSGGRRVGRRPAVAGEPLTRPPTRQSLPRQPLPLPTLHTNLTTCIPAYIPAHLPTVCR
jgi:hypothetical protein